MATGRENGLSKTQTSLLDAVCVCNYLRLPLARQHKQSLFVSRFLSLPPFSVFIFHFFHYNRDMNTIDKFLSDIQKTIKYDRANNGGHYDAKRACTQIAKLFETNNRNLGSLAVSISDYWLNTYILGSADLANEPDEENIGRIKAFQSFCDADEEADYSILTADDWENLRDFVDDEAENLDLDALQNMMNLILQNGALE